jgi:hypothetical protein
MLKMGVLNSRDSSKLSGSVTEQIKNRLPRVELLNLTLQCSFPGEGPMKETGRTLGEAAKSCQPPTTSISISLIC